MSVLLHPQVFNVAPNTLNREHDFAQLIIEHAIRTIVADLMLNMLLSQQASSGFRFPPYTPPQPNQFKQQPQFFSSMPRQKPNVDRAQQPNEPKQEAAPTFVMQASSAVKGVQGIATKFDPNGKTQKEQQAVAQHLHAFQQAKTPDSVQEAYDQLKVSLGKLVRRLGLLVHPDKNPAPEATEAFKQLNDLREQFDNTRGETSR